MKTPFARVLVIFFITAGLTSAGIVAYPHLTPKIRTAYRSWHQKRALQQARTAIAAKDDAQASLALEIALKDDPTNAEVWRVAAEMADQSGSQQALILRKQFLQLNSATTIDKIALAKTALRFSDLATAESALRSIAEVERNSVAFQEVAAAHALAANNLAAANALFDELLKKNPSDENVQFSVAMLRLRHPKPDAAQSARHDLEKIATERANHRLAALRVLTVDAVTRRDATAANHYATELTATPSALFSDRLTAANVKLNAEPQNAESIIASLASEGAHTLDNAIEYARWLFAQQRLAYLLRWLPTLPEALQTQPTIKAIEADALAATGDWLRLLEKISVGAWGPIASNTVQVAFSARAMKPELRDQVWQQTLATNSLRELRILLRLASLWQWQPETTATLASITEKFPRELWAHEALARAYVSQRDTASLQLALANWMRADPKNLRVQNDWALVTMLRDGSPRPNPAKQTAATLYEAEPNNPTVITTQAYALAQLGRITESLELVDKLRPSDRQLAARAPYLAYVYARGQRPDDVRAQVELARTVDLLPEEKVLAETTLILLATPANHSKR